MAGRNRWGFLGGSFNADFRGILIADSRGLSNELRSLNVGLAPHHAVTHALAACALPFIPFTINPFAVDFRDTLTVPRILTMSEF